MHALILLPDAVATEFSWPAALKAGPAPSLWLPQATALQCYAHSCHVATPRTKLVISS